MYSYTACSAACNICKVEASATATSAPASNQIRIYLIDVGSCHSSDSRDAPDDGQAERDVFPQVAELEVGHELAVLGLYHRVRQSLKSTHRNVETKPK